MSTLDLRFVFCGHVFRSDWTISALVVCRKTVYDTY